MRNYLEHQTANCTGELCRDTEGPFDLQSYTCDTCGEQYTVQQLEAFADCRNNTLFYSSETKNKDFFFRWTA